MAPPLNCHPEHSEFEEPAVDFSGPEHAEKGQERNETPITQFGIESALNCCWNLYIWHSANDSPHPSIGPGRYRIHIRYGSYCGGIDSPL
jgi:hypothetical protein